MAVIAAEWKYQVASGKVFGHQPCHLGIDLAKWPTLKAYVERVAQRPAVQAALKAEGLAA